MNDKIEVNLNNTVEINSSVAVTIFEGNTYKDMTNYNAQLPDSFKIAPSWHKSRADIRKGISKIPANVVEWIPFKKLVALNLITYTSGGMAQIAKGNHITTPEVKDVPKVKDSPSGIPAGKGF